MILLMLSGQLADLASTVWAVTAGSHEANPVWYQDSLWVLVPVKLVGIALMIAIVLYFRKRSLFASWFCALIAMTVGFYAAGHNMGVIL